MKNCFNQILIGLNITDSLHIVFAILDGIRNNFEDSYPTFLMRIFPYFHYPFYRYNVSILILASVRFRSVPFRPPPPSLARTKYVCPRMG